MVSFCLSSDLAPTTQNRSAEVPVPVTVTGRASGRPLATCLLATFIHHQPSFLARADLGGGGGGGGGGGLAAGGGGCDRSPLIRNV